MIGHIRSSPRPYKRCPSTPPPSHCPGVLPLSFPPLLSSTVVTAFAEPDVAGEMPLHRLLTHGDPTVELAGPSFPSLDPWPELSDIGVARGRAPVSSRVWQWPPVHGGPVAPRSTAPWTESMGFFCPKIIPENLIFRFSREICRKAHRTSNIHNFSTTTPNSVILLSQFLESLPLSFCAFI
jgi:hypothetical protein